MRYKLTILIVATVLLIVGSIGETLYIKNTFDDFCEKLEAQTDKETYCLKDVTELSEWWTEKAEMLENFISVLQLNEITVTMGELTGAVKKEDYASANALLDRIYQYAVRIRDMYMVKFNNIF